MHRPTLLISGDSFTAQYPHQWDDVFPQYDVVNLAVAGMGTHYIAASVEQWCMAEGDPHRCLIIWSGMARLDLVFSQRYHLKGVKPQGNSRFHSWWGLLSPEAVAQNREDSEVKRYARFLHSDPRSLVLHNCHRITLNQSFLESRHINWCYSWIYDCFNPVYLQPEAPLNQQLQAVDPHHELVRGWKQHRIARPFGMEYGFDHDGFQPNDCHLTESHTLEWRRRLARDCDRIWNDAR